MTRSPVPRHDDQARRRGGGLLSKLVAAILVVAIAVCGGVWYQAGAPAASRDAGVVASQDAAVNSSVKEAICNFQFDTAETLRRDVKLFPAGDNDLRTEIIRTGRIAMPRSSREG